MTYEEMCRYIVAKEGYIWEEFILANKKRDQEYSRTRQICFYFAYVFFKNMPYRTAGAIFGKDHATALYAVGAIEDLIKYNVEFRRKIADYHSKLANSIYSNWPSDTSEAEQLVIDVQKTIDQMKRIAEAYCKIAGKRMV